MKRTRDSDVPSSHWSQEKTDKVVQDGVKKVEIAFAKVYPEPVEGLMNR
jgi:hypothetical protein